MIGIIFALSLMLVFMLMIAAEDFAIFLRQEKNAFDAAFVLDATILPAHCNPNPYEL